jgi:hypothetical protein
MKVNSTIYKGIEYIQVNSLPPDQQKLLLQTINRDLLIKILVEGKLVGDCLQFKDYEVWFDNIFKGQTKSSTSKKDQPERSPQSTVFIGVMKKI